jgi:3-oxoacyl-[acyl-carrier protein] reductase
MTIQTYLVSGAAGALGTATTQILLGRGHRVVATDLDAEALTETAGRRCWTQERLVIRALDVRRPEAWDEVLEEVTTTWGLDVAIHMAGHIHGAPFWTQPAEEAIQHLESNALGVFLGTAAAAKRMVEVGRGHIINVASMAALMPSPGFAFYAGAKYAVRGFSLAAAAELAAHGVAVTVACPATIDSPMYESQKAYYAATQGRLASTPLTVDAVVEALLSPRVLRSRPVEVNIPPLKGVIARGADLFPGAFNRLLTTLRGSEDSEGP